MLRPTSVPRRPSIAPADLATLRHHIKQIETTADGLIYDANILHDWALELQEAVTRLASARPMKGGA